MSTVALLSLALAIVPQLFGGQSALDPESYASMSDLLDSLLRIWAIDLVVISISIEHVSLSLSIIPFLCIFPTALMICLADGETFIRMIGLGILTIVFVLARYLANSL
jgi:hypothetical protein